MPDPLFGNISVEKLQSRDWTRANPGPHEFEPGGGTAIADFGLAFEEVDLSRSEFVRWDQGT